MAFDPRRLQRSRSGERRVERLAGEDGLQGGQQRLALVAQGRQVASEARERRATGIAAEAAGDFLLQLEPAQVTLRLVVVEEDGKVVEEGQHLVLPEGESLEQVARGRLGEASRWPGLRRATGGGLAANPAASTSR